MTAQLRLSTDDLPERDRFPTFCEEVVRRYAALDMELTSLDTAFRGSIALQHVGSSAISTVTTTPARFVRTPRWVRDGDDGLCVFLGVTGAIKQTQQGTSYSVASAGGVICDNAYAGTLEATAASRFWCLKVPRAKLTPLLPLGMKLASARLDRHPVALRLLLSYLENTRDIDFAGSPQAASLYDDHLRDLLALALGAEGDARMVVEQRGGRAARRDAILKMIAAALADPELSIGVVAQHLGITPRYVNMLLEETGHSFSEHLLDKRLGQAAALLTDPRYREQKIAAIAFACGFGDLSYFNRTFRRRYGATPSEWRAGAPRNDADRGAGKRFTPS